MGSRSSRPGNADRSGAASSGRGRAGLAPRSTRVPVPAAVVDCPASLRTRTSPSITSARVWRSVALTRNWVPRTAAMAAGVRISKRPPGPLAGRTRLSTAPRTISSCTWLPSPRTGRWACSKRTWVSWRTRACEPSSNSSWAVDCAPVRSRVPASQVSPWTAARMLPSGATRATSPCTFARRTRVSCSRIHGTGMRKVVPGGIRRSLRMPLCRARRSPRVGVSR